MFTRLVEMISKAGKSQELANTINDRAVPILKKTTRLRGLDRARFVWKVGSGFGFEFLE